MKNDAACLELSLPALRVKFGTQQALPGFGENQIAPSTSETLKLIDALWTGEAQYSVALGLAGVTLAQNEYKAW